MGFVKVGPHLLNGQGLTLPNGAELCRLQALRQLQPDDSPCAAEGGCQCCGGGLCCSNAQACLLQLLKLRRGQACNQADAVPLAAEGFEQYGFAQIVFVVQPVLPMRGVGRKRVVARLPNSQGGHGNATELGDRSNAVERRAW